MTLRNFDATLLAADGSDFKFREDDGKLVSQTQSQFVRNLLFNGPMEENNQPKNISGDRRYKMFQLMEKIAKGGDVDISSDEAGLIMQVIEKMQPGLYGQINASLNRDLTS